MSCNLKHYFVGKLSAINYRIAVHEGNANKRLASEAPEILYKLGISFKGSIPKNREKEFSKFISLIERTIINAQGRIPVRIGNIKNKTAAKYIKLLIDIREELRHTL